MGAAQAWAAISSGDPFEDGPALTMALAQVRRRLSLLIPVIAGSMVVFAVNYGFFVRTTLGQELDNAALVGGEHEPQGVISEAWDLLDIISVASLALACAVIGVVALLRKRVAMAAAPRWRSTIALVSVPFAVAVAVAVVTAAWHRSSDSIAAFCVVLGVAAASLSAVVAFFGFNPGARPPRWFRRSVLVLVATATLVLGGLELLGLWAVKGRLSDGPLGPRWESVAYASSTAGIAAAAIVVMTSLVLARRGIAVGHGGWPRTDDATTDPRVNAKQAADTSPCTRALDLEGVVLPHTARSSDLQKPLVRWGTRSTAERHGGRRA